MAFKILFLLCIRLISSLGSAEICQHKLVGESGIIQYPTSKPSEKLPNLALKSEDLSKNCIFFKNIDKKKLTLKFKSVDLNGGVIKIKTTKSKKPKWKIFKKISGKTKKATFSIKGIKYVKISVEKNYGSFQLEYSLTTQPVATCQKLSKPVKTVKCTKGIKVGSKCILTCDEGFTPNQYIKKNNAKKFTVSCRKINARNGLWKPTLNRLLCGKGKKTLKECKKQFELCIPAAKTTSSLPMVSTTESPSTPSLRRVELPTSSTRAPLSVTSPLTMTSRFENNSDAIKTTPKEQRLTSSTDSMESTLREIAGSRLQDPTERNKPVAPTRGALILNIRNLPALEATSITKYDSRAITNSPKTQSSTAKRFQEPLVRTEPLAPAGGTIMLTSSTPKTTQPTTTLTDILHHSIITTTSQYATRSSSPRTTSQRVRTEPTPPPVHLIFILYPELHPSYKKPSTTKSIDVYGKPLSATTSNPVGQGPLITTAATPSYDKDHAPTSRQSAIHSTQAKPATRKAINDETTSSARLTTTQSGRDTTNQPEPIPTYISSRRIVTSDGNFRTVHAAPATTKSQPQSTSLSPTIEETRTTKSSIAPTAVSITTTTPKTSPTSSRTSPIPTKRTTVKTKVQFRRFNIQFVKPPPRIRVTTTQSTTGTPTPTLLTGTYTTNQPVSIKVVFRICAKAFCVRSAATGRYTRTCASYQNASMKKVCNICRYHPASPCNMAVGFP